ncbi:hypothetical protein [Brevundimonas vesicularis]|uniref:hypothetical protein n=1 Tax=Brevundimonas vesicularis TaxID=41276 RepID=UPI0022ABF097|nr:hypothetical protein [Brevundimonas vesicularis]
MSDPIDTRVTPSLHVANVARIAGYDDDTRSYLAPTETAFSEAYVGIGRIHDAKAAADRNPSWTPDERLIQTQAFAEKTFASIARRFDSAGAALTRSIEALEAELSAPIASKAAQGVASEIRAYAKALQGGERMSFIQRAIDDGDDLTVGAVLGAPAYLSGIERKTQEVYTRAYHERANPLTAKKLRAMQGALDLIGQRSGLVFKEIEKAVGAPPHKVQALKKAKAHAERAFVMPKA